MNLTRSGRIEELAKGVCEEELKENEDCRPGIEPGHTISCMTEKLNQIKVCMRESVFHQFFLLFL